MKYIYNICIYIYWLGIFIASWFNNKAKLFIKGREGLIKRVENEVKSGDDITWIHCSSVGEFEQARPVIEKIKKENNSKILLTFFSPSGYELRKNYNLADWVYYMPLDTRKNAKAFIKAINPKRAIFVKYEFWYNHLYELKRNNIEIYIISAIFRPGQIFFKWYGFFFRKMLHLFTILFVQDERSKQLLEDIGITNNVIIGGDTRFDRVNEIASKSKDLPIIESFAKEYFTLVAGSSWEPDELMLAKTLKNFSKAKLILVPHEIGSDRIKKILQIFSEYKIIKYTDILSEYQNISNVDNANTTISAANINSTASANSSANATIAANASCSANTNSTANTTIAANTNSTASANSSANATIAANTSCSANTTSAANANCSANTNSAANASCSANTNSAANTSCINNTINDAINNANVIIIDTIGMLSSIYKYGNCAYIGGGFGVGIHNILEAATYGIPVIFGPNYYKFKEAKDLLKIGGAYSVKNDSEFYEIFTDLIKNRSLLESKGQICRKYVESNLGATNKIYQKIF